ncbi:MAG TPA: hypothetical protein VFI47_23655 [Acidimicrobiales bacterium]|nr:hypothetical protein [Acidimicrobiales bacterium]
MTGLVSLGLALLGSWCVWLGAREWRRREEEIAADDAFLGAGRWGHRSNWLRVRGHAVAFVAVGLVLVVLSGARVLASS